MLVNEATALVGPTLVLVPYQRSHVPTYHAWMSDPAIREATASDELSLEEEFEMQRSWRLDEDKLTFIIHTFSSTTPPASKVDVDLSTMIGDVNLFLSKAYPDDDSTDDPVTRAECEIMIAVPTARRRSHALSALHLFLPYASDTLHLPPSAFFARIGVHNEGSIRLFEKLGFRRGKVSVFEEVEMVWAGEGQEWGWQERGEVRQVEREPPEEK